jgi:hypothetical protein
MPELAIEADLKLAQKICDDLKIGDNTSLNEWVRHYYPEMYRLILKKQFSPSLHHGAENTGSGRDHSPDGLKEAEDFLHQFYLELSKGNAFCLYRGINNCSLKSYIIGRLIMRCLRPKQVAQDTENSTDAVVPPVIISIDGSANALAIPDPDDLPEKQLSDRQTHLLSRSLIAEAIDRLSANPKTIEDAAIIRWHMDGLGYSEMAERLLILQDVKPVDASDIVRESARIRKRLTRKESGVLVRLGKIIQQLMREKNITPMDMDI